ncbi:polysaccharide pyruvyl transferase family protein, partial [Mariniblastus sp.]|nr:polysaccharide pyruvyl transferase family protein [Mariniblastus sp.]
FEYRPNLTRFYQMRKRFSNYRYYGVPRNKGTRFCAVGLGIGPFATSKARKIAMNPLKYHDFIFTRDKTSHDFAVNNGIENSKLGHDICFLEIDKIQEAKSETRQIANCATFVIREYKYGDQNENCLKNMIKLAKFLKADGFQIRWVSFQPGYDDPAIEKIRSLGDTIWQWNPNTMQIEDGYLLMAESSLIITARMHGTYIAGMLGLPCLSLSLHPKLKYAAEYFSNSNCVSPKCLDGVLEAGKLLLNEKEGNFSSEQICTINQDVGKMVRTVENWLV